MTIDDDTRGRLMEAGAAAIRFNAPLGADRVADISTFVGAHAASVVDLGCGAGALAIDLAERNPDLRSLGLDSNEAVIARARSAAARSQAADRIRFEVEDVAPVEGSPAGPSPADAAICIGSTHAFGDTRAALAAMMRWGTRAAVVGDGIWTAEPEPQHRDWFGDLQPGEEALAELARSVGWAVADQGRSTVGEWDAFELGWIAGVRAVGTPEAEAFADERLADYHAYREVLGFGWLFLTR